MTQVIDFFRQVRLEIRKITWPSRRETLLTTVSVCVLMGILSFFFLVIDWGLSSGISLILSLGS